MISDGDLPELASYRRIERRLPFESRFEYSGLVIPLQNNSLPGHRWFRFKEGFSADLLDTVIAGLWPHKRKHFNLLDPFCGVGTALLASQELHAKGYRVSAVGIERNPFLHFVATTKVSWPVIPLTGLVERGDRAVAEAGAGSIPVLSSLHEGRCMSRYMARKIDSYRRSLLEVQDPHMRAALMLGLASTVETVSKTRKDGRALRIVERPPTPLLPLLRSRWDLIQGDSRFLRTCLPDVSIPKVHWGDGRSPSSSGVEPNSVDLILTSPPYPNNIDYSEVYKLELWLLNFIQTEEEFLSLRHGTFRSHPTMARSTPDPEFLSELKRGLLARVLGPLVDRALRANDLVKHRVLLGYFSDLWTALKNHFECLKAGGYEVLVVGNSLHGSAGCAYLIPTDIALALIAKCIGFEVQSVLATRVLKRRLQGNHFLRDSFVVLRKPHAR